MAASERTVPFDPEAERGVLAAIIQSNGEKLGDVAGILAPEDFYGTAHRLTYQAMAALSERCEPVDPVTLRAELERAGELDAAGGAGFVATILEGFPRSVNAVAYARIVKEKAQKRKLAEVAEQTLNDALADRDDAAAIAERFRARVELIGVDGGEAVRCRTLTEIRADPDALRPPVVVVPRLAWSGRVALLAGREKLGKSTLLAAATADLSQGRPWLGEWAGEPGTILWLGLEEHVADIDARFRHWRADPDRVYVISDMSTAADPLAAVRAAATEVRPSLIVVDTLAALVERLALDPGSSTAWTPVMAALARIARETDAALVLVHHARKSDGAYRDSTAIGAGVDAILELSEGRDESERRLRVRARWPVEDYAVRLIASGYQLSRGELSLDARVLLHVEKHPGCSLSAVCREVRGKQGDVSAAVHRLLDNGALKNRGSDRAMKLFVARTDEPDTVEEPLPEPLPADSDEALPETVTRQLPRGDRQGNGDRYPAGNPRGCPAGNAGAVEVSEDEPGVPDDDEDDALFDVDDHPVPDRRREEEVEL